MKNLIFPENKQFAFTIIDDTDDAFLSNIAPVYDILHENGLKTTKTIWVYPPRDIQESKGDCLQNPQYLKFVQDIQLKGFEIGLHNVGSGGYVREEIIQGLEEYKRHLKTYPSIHVNHSYNKDNIYSGSKRFSFPLNLIVKKLYSQYDGFSGDSPNSEFFWGDLHKKYIKYARNYEIDDINTIKKISNMPYKEKRFDEYSNFWFSSTFAPNQWMFKHIVNRKSIDRLEKERGICILYTHLGYYQQFGKIDPGFKEMIEYIGTKKNGWFVPVGKILDFLIENKKQNFLPEYLPFFTQKRMEFHTLKTRIKYRYINKIDDFHFKKSDGYER
jgi:hypothetical protein